MPLVGTELPPIATISSREPKNTFRTELSKRVSMKFEKIPKLERNTERSLVGERIAERQNGHKFIDRTLERLLNYP